MPDDGRILQIITDGNRQPPRLSQLPRGYVANYITLREMAKIVRHDSALGDLRNLWTWAVLKDGSLKERLDRAFDFCRDTIRYKPEDEGFETIADLFSTCFALNFRGDCILKSVGLATLLCYLNLKPWFVAVRQLAPVHDSAGLRYPLANTDDYFNHVYVQTIFEGKVISLDPTPPDFRPGDSVRGYVELKFNIFK